jgi:hypothetical protein
MRAGSLMELESSLAVLSSSRAETYNVVRPRGCSLHRDIPHRVSFENIPTQPRHPATVCSYETADPIVEQCRQE